MNDKPLDLGNGDGQKGRPHTKDKRNEPRGLSRRGEHQEHSPMIVDQDNWDNHGWSWSHGLHIIYHPRGCNTCMEYSRHIMEAEFIRDDEYIAAQRIRNKDSDQWWSRAIRAQEDLGEADDYAKSLKVGIRELEKELACPHDYKDNRGGKRARYDSPYEGESGMNSPAPRRRGPQPLHQPL
jgi:hypothetical protein